MDISNPEHVRQAELQARMAQDQLMQDVRKALKDPANRRVFYHILAQAGLYTSQFTKDSRTFYNCGWVDFGRMVLDLINQANPHAYIQMLNENLAEQIRQQKQRSVTPDE